MHNTLYIFTPNTDINKLHETLQDFQSTTEAENIKLPLLQTEISDGDAYFLKQREGMLNFYSSLLNPNYMEIHSNFLMHLASCTKGYKINFESEESITTLVNAFVDNMEGLIFSPSMAFYTKDWKLIIDSSGSCELESYNFTLSAAAFDEEANTNANPESENRKKQSISKLQSLNIPVLDSLPTIPSTDQAHYRSEHELATRIISLAAVAVKGELKTSDISYSVLEKYAIHPDDVSPWELNFLNNPTPEEQDFVNAIWRYEALNVLMWATGYVDDLHFPSDIVEVTSITENIRECKDFEHFLMFANMRDMSEILDELDLTYRLHWACVDARVNNQPAPANVNPSVVYERHYALNWLINRYNENWDNVSVPT